MKQIIIYTSKKFDIEIYLNLYNWGLPFHVYNGKFHLFIDILFINITISKNEILYKNI